jgi:hypothetical protein
MCLACSLTWTFGRLVVFALISAILFIIIFIVILLSIGGIFFFVIVDLLFSFF